ncbi:hypothetical protein STEG23_031581 [Scotinomys teguina]
MRQGEMRAQPAMEKSTCNGMREKREERRWQGQNGAGRDGRMGGGAKEKVEEEDEKIKKGGRRRKKRRKFRKVFPKAHIDLIVISLSTQTQATDDEFHYSSKNKDEDKPSILRVGLPTSINLIKTIFHKNAWRPASLVTLDPYEIRNASEKAPDEEFQVKTATVNDKGQVFGNSGWMPTQVWDDLQPYSLPFTGSFGAISLVMKTL